MPKDVETIRGFQKSPAPRPTLPDSLDRGDVTRRLLEACTFEPDRLISVTVAPDVHPTAELIVSLDIFGFGELACRLLEVHDLQAAQVTFGPDGAHVTWHDGSTTHVPYKE